MSEPHPEPNPAAELDADQVIAYLREHPDFLDQHPEALEAQKLAHESGGAVSLIERQVNVLRGQNAQLRARLTELVDTARGNELRVQHMNGLAKVLIEAQSAGALAEGLRDFLREQMAVDALYLGIIDAPEAPEAPAGGIQTLTPDGPAMQAVTNAFRRGKPLCGPIDPEQVQALFPRAGETPPQSAAMIPLGGDTVRGVLVLASRDSRRFVPDMGTMFLELMGALVTSACRRHLGADLI